MALVALLLELAVRLGCLLDFVESSVLELISVFKTSLIHYCDALENSGFQVNVVYYKN